MDNTSLVYKNITRQLISIGCLLFSAFGCEYQPTDSSATGDAGATSACLSQKRMYLKFRSA